MLVNNHTREGLWKQNKTRKKCNNHCHATASMRRAFLALTDRESSSKNEWQSAEITSLSSLKVGPKQQTNATHGMRMNKTVSLGTQGEVAFSSSFKSLARRAGP